jgi:hypothetical protein
MTAFDWVAQILGILAALLAAPLFLGWVNQCRAWLQNKSAPPLMLPYRTIRKLFHKDAVIASNASPLFRLAPYVVFGTMVTAAAIIPSIATRLPVHAGCGRNCTRRPVRNGARVRIARSDGCRNGFRYAGCSTRNDDRLPGRARAADGHLCRLADRRDHGAAADLRAARNTVACAVPEPGLHRGGIHDGAAGRERAHPGRQSGDAPGADDDSRGSAAGVLGAPPGPDGVGAALKLFNYVCIGFALFIPWGLATSQAPFVLTLSLLLLGAKLVLAGAGIALIETVSAKLRVFRAPEFLATAFLFAVLGLLVRLLLGA